jgi:hypothetical protein
MPRCDSASVRTLSMSAFAPLLGGKRALSRGSIKPIYDLDGVEPAWTLLTFESLRALRHEPSAVQTAIRIANDRSACMIYMIYMIFICFTPI